MEVVLGVGLGVEVAVPVGVGVKVAVLVGVGVEVAVLVGVGVEVAVLVEVGVDVAVLVEVGVDVAEGIVCVAGIVSVAVAVGLIVGREPSRRISGRYMLSGLNAAATDKTALEFANPKDSKNAPSSITSIVNSKRDFFLFLMVTSEKMAGIVFAGLIVFF